MLILTHAHLGECHARLLSSTQAGDDLQRHFAAHAEASQLPTVLLDGLAREVALQQLHAGNIHLQLVDEVLREVAVLKSTMMVNDSAGRRHDAHDDLEQRRFTRAVLAHNANPRL